MLRLIIDQEEYFDEETETFSWSGGFELELEHSLVSLSKWESIVKKPFLSPEPRSTAEILLYIECMIISPTFPPGVTSKLGQEQIDRIKEYIESTESATTFGEMPEVKGRGELITSELIYYWMVAFNIPFECETWHLNRLFSLIRICNVKMTKPKKMTHAELMARNRRLNEERRKLSTTLGDDWRFDG